MKTAIFTSLIASLYLALSADLIAQETAPVIPGDRIRITLPNEKLVCTFVNYEANRLVVKAKNREEPFAISLASVQSLAVSRGRKSKGRKYALIGLGVGGVVGIFAGASVGSEPNQLVLLYIGLFAGAGAGVGYAIGGGEQWEEVPLERIRVGILPHGDGGLMVSASFSF